MNKSEEDSDFYFEDGSDFDGGGAGGTEGGESSKFNFKEAISPNKDLPVKSLGSDLRSLLSVPVAGGSLEPAKVGRGYGVKWSTKFAEGGKIKSESKASTASRRGDGIAQRGKTKGRYL
jgi:hypothetical protein